MDFADPAALRYLLTDAVYLLPQDRDFYLNRPEPAAVQTPEIDFKYLGGYKKRFLIISHYPQHEFMEPGHLTALQSSLQRKDYMLDDVAILNISAYTDVDYPALYEQLKPEKVLILGTEALLAGAPVLQLNQPVRDDEQWLLHTYSFAAMVGNKENTKAFWNIFKTY